MAEILTECLEQPNQDCSGWAPWLEKAQTNLNVGREEFLAPTGYPLTTPIERYVEFASRSGCPIGAERYKALDLCLNCAAAEGDREKINHFLFEGALDLPGATYQATRHGHQDLALELLYKELDGAADDRQMYHAMGLAERGLLAQDPPPVGVIDGEVSTINKTTAWGILIGGARGGHSDLVVYATLFMDQFDQTALLAMALEAWGEGSGNQVTSDVPGSRQNGNQRDLQLLNFLFDSLTDQNLEGNSPQGSSGAVPGEGRVFDREIGRRESPTETLTDLPPRKFSEVLLQTSFNLGQSDAEVGFKGLEKEIKNLNLQVPDRSMVETLLTEMRTNFLYGKVRGRQSLTEEEKSEALKNLPRLALEIGRGGAWEHLPLLTQRLGQPSEVLPQELPIWEEVVVGAAWGGHLDLIHYILPHVESAGLRLRAAWRAEGVGYEDVSDYLTEEMDTWGDPPITSARVEEGITV